MKNSNWSTSTFFLSNQQVVKKKKKLVTIDASADTADTADVADVADVTDVADVESVVPELQPEVLGRRLDVAVLEPQAEAQEVPLAPELAPRMPPQLPFHFRLDVAWTMKKYG